MNTPWVIWTERWEWIRQCLARKGCEDFEIKIHPPLPQARIDEFELETGLALPRDFVETLTQFARSIDFDWSLTLQGDGQVLSDEDPRVQVRLEQLESALQHHPVKPKPGELLNVVNQEMKWLKPPDNIGPSGGETGCGPMWLPMNGNASDNLLNQYHEFQGEMEGIVRECQPEQYDSASHRGFLPIMWLGDGDVVVLDLARDPAPVIHLDHEGCYLPEDRTQIGLDFSSFMTRWSNIACVSPDRYTLGKFLSKMTPQIDAQGTAAKKWIAWLESDDRGVGEVDESPPPPKPKKGLMGLLKKIPFFSR